MLEVIELKKIYKTKGGADVRALDGVSLRLPEKGMVFLLGKSGSGKSTLLNVCGGLDSPTEGEIVVKGRSSKDFTQSDFDSYRNTFIGFVFQEYNILNEFSVEDNIALALELQGKPKDKKAIAEILEKVDLAGYARRKPNTLSGGQKQRIAIARALVKNPEIIMADEPTGALDSATGKQVFDTLKKLSEDKLVIVVSHDREFAEQYGDRVIELKDGKIISDVTKTKEKSESLSGNLTAAGDTLCVKSGTTLSDADFEAIKAFLSKTAGSVVIASGDKDVKTFKQAARLTEDCSKEVFRETVENETPKRSYSPQESAFIRSKLPVRHAVKIGVSGLKSKPVRLFFTILLCTVSFVMFGLLSTMMVYDEDATLKKSLLDSDYAALQLNKSYRSLVKKYNGDTLESEWETSQDTAFTPKEVIAFKEKYGKKTLGAVKMSGSVDNTYTQPGIYYSPQIAYALSAADGEAYADKLLYGSFPDTQEGICLSSYQADCLLKSGLYNPENHEAYTLTERESLLNKRVSLGNTSFTVVGIYDCGELPTKYNSLKNGDGNNDWTLRDHFEGERRSGLYLAAFFSAEFIEEYTSSPVEKPGDALREEFFRYFPKQREVEVSYKTPNDMYFRYAFYASSDTLPFPKLFFESSKTAQENNEILLSASMYESYYHAAAEEKLQNLSEGSEEYRDFYHAYLISSDENGNEAASYLEKLQTFSYGKTPDGRETLTFEQRKSLFEELRVFAEKYALPFETIRLSLSYGTLSRQQNSVPVGVFLYDNEYASGYSALALSEDDFDAFKKVSDAIYGGNQYREERTTKYVVPEDAIYAAVFLPYDRSEKVTSQIVSAVGKTAEDDSMVYLNNPIAAGIEEVDYMVDALSKVFLWTGVILAVFSALLLCNFISVSISYKKKEIGILRAVGARSFDVFKIFFSESFVITAICVLLSIVGGGIACAVLNKEIGAMFAGASVFVFGPLSILMLLGVALLTAIFATFLPVYHAARKKPVESIRAL